MHTIFAKLMRMVIPFGCVYLGTGSVHPSPSGHSPEGVARLYLGIIRPLIRLQSQYVKGRPVGHSLVCVSALRLHSDIASAQGYNVPAYEYIISLVQLCKAEEVSPPPAM